MPVYITLPQESIENSRNEGKFFFLRHGISDECSCDSSHHTDTGEAGVIQNNLSGG